MPDDFATCLSFFKNPASNRYWKSAITDPVLLCREWFDKQQWRYIHEKGGANILVHKKTQQMIGWCGLLVQIVDGSEELEVGYSIMPEHWGNGYATEAAKICIDYAFAHNLSDSVISIIQINNRESIRVAEKNGMKITKETVYHDNAVYVYRISKRT